MAELCLGTVQFGMRYGINNRDGQPVEGQCFEMLDMAAQNGLRFLDTARAYGTAELVLGEYFKAGTPFDGKRTCAGIFKTRRAIFSEI